MLGTLCQRCQSIMKQVDNIWYCGECDDIIVAEGQQKGDINGRVYEGEQRAAS